MRLRTWAPVNAWFCEALKGYVLDSDDRTREAEPHLLSAVREAPDSVRRAYTDATWLVGSWDQRNLSLAPPDVRKQVRRWDCARIEAVADTLAGDGRKEAAGPSVGAGVTFDTERSPHGLDLGSHSARTDRSGAEPNLGSRAASHGPGGRAAAD